MPEETTVPPAALMAALRDMAELVSEPTTIDDILQRVGDHCAEVLPVDAVGVLLGDEDGGLAVVTASSEFGRKVEELEAEAGDGPCSRARETGLLIPVVDLEQDAEHYPRFAPPALAAGVRSVYAIPMTHRGEQVGAFDVVSADVVDLTAEQLAVAQLLADVTTAYIANNRLLDAVSLRAMHLQRALDSRVVIEQAKGTLAERYDISPTEAFERMRRHARSNHLKIEAVARDVLAGHLQV